MAEDTARALGAGSTETIIIAGKECRARPLSIKELTEVERDCLRRYKRSYLETFSENADLFGASSEEEMQRLVREKADEAARWDVSSLPPKHAYDANRIKINDALKKYLTETIGVSEEGKLGKQETQRRLKGLAAYALDSGTLSPEEYEQMTGSAPVKGKVGYVNWWITGTFDGMITMVWMAFRDNGVTRDEVATELGKNPDLLATMAREIEKLSAPEPGNG